MPANSDLSILKSKQTVVVLALAKAGLGHLRVTNALYKGLPQGVHATLLGSQDDAITWLHRLMSVNHRLRSVMEWVQTGAPEDIFTLFYRQSLRDKTKLIYQQLSTILDQQVELPERLVVVATHFGLAHQIAAIKDKLAKERGVEINLTVVVTDDSPQHIWAVGGADYIFVPSKRTKNALERYHLSQKMAPSQYVISPYVVSPKLAIPLTQHQQKERSHQLNPHHNHPIQIAIPISGAAVQLDYFTTLIQHLNHKPHDFNFHVISKNAAYTNDFLTELLSVENTKIYSSDKDRIVVEKFEEVYQQEIISLEVTKPSEQSFKALIPPSAHGGSILLFSKPVGRQEYDNVNFLRRHNIMPDKDIQQRLFKAAKTDEPLPDALKKEVDQEVHGWRALMLPLSPKDTADFIAYCLKEGIFTKMLQFSGYMDHPELSPDGANIFWHKLAGFLK